MLRAFLTRVIHVNCRNGATIENPGKSFFRHLIGGNFKKKKWVYAEDWRWDACHASPATSAAASTAHTDYETNNIDIYVETTKCTRQTYFPHTHKKVRKPWSPHSKSFTTNNVTTKSNHKSDCETAVTFLGKLGRLGSICQYSVTTRRIRNVEHELLRITG